MLLRNTESRTAILLLLYAPIAAPPACCALTVNTLFRNALPVTVMLLLDATRAPPVASATDTFDSVTVEAATDSQNPAAGHDTTVYPAAASVAAEVASEVVGMDGLIP